MELVGRVVVPVAGNRGEEQQIGTHVWTTLPRTDPATEQNIDSEQEDTYTHIRSL